MKNSLKQELKLKKIQCDGIVEGSNPKILKSNPSSSNILIFFSKIL